jgi:cell cycle sensor histidine kinase DivJ
MNASLKATLADSFRPNLAEPVAPELRDVLRWHAGWAIGLVVAGLALSFGLGAGQTMPTLSVLLALAAGLAPAAGAFVLSRGDTARTRDLVLVLWAVGGSLACGLTGGVSGPLAVWCVTPIAAAAVLGGSRKLAQGSALALLAAAVTALAQATRLVGPTPGGLWGFGLGLTGLGSIAMGLAAAMLLAHRRVNRAGEAQEMLNRGLRDLLSQQPHMVITLDQTGRVDGAHGGAFRYLLPAQRLLEDGLLSAAAESSRAALAAALSTAIVQGRATLTFPLADADQVWFAIELRRLSETRLIGALRNATADHEREMALERARADAESLNAGKSRFLANMSHELRTPLNAIMGFSDIMRQRLFGTLPGRYSEYADLIHDAGSHLLDLINDVLDMSKIEAARYELSMERLDAREPIQAALRLMRLQADDAGVQLRGVLPSQPLDVEADRRALKQIALNLVSNALKFTPKGGLVTVSLHSLAGAMELSVADTGLGIAASDVERLGRPFEQAGDAMQQSKGTGLGLSLVRAFAELHGGEMVIESRLGEGTAVTVRLPVLAPPDDQSDLDRRSERDKASGSRRDVPGGGKVIAFNAQR